jgi:hypothetical protein
VWSQVELVGGASDAGRPLVKDMCRARSPSAAVNTAEVTDDGADFVTGQHHGQADGPLGTDDVVEREWASTAREIKSRVTSGPPISRAWRLPWKRMYRRIHAK